MRLADSHTLGVCAFVTKRFLVGHNARRVGLAKRMALAVTEHDVHLFQTRVADNVIGDCVATLPYGEISAIHVSGWMAGAEVTIERVDGTQIH